MTCQLVGPKLELGLISVRRYLRSVTAMNMDNEPGIVLGTACAKVSQASIRGCPWPP